MLCIDTDVIIGDLNKGLGQTDDEGVGLAIMRLGSGGGWS